MDDVVFGSDEVGRLILTEPVRGSDGEIWSVLVVVDAGGLRAERRVSTHYASHFDDLITFVDELAESWRGWKGSKTYTSLEREFVLRATHDGQAHVHLAVTLKGPTNLHQWSIEAAVVTDPGAQMREAAEAARTLLAAKV